MTENENKNNNIEQVTDIVPENEIDNIFTSLTDKDPKGKQYKFYLYYLFGFPIKTCANKAGYAESTGYAMVQKYKKSDKLRRTVDEILNMFPDRYKSICKLRLPQVAEIEGKTLQEFEKDPKLAINKPQLLKQIKQASGVLNEDGPTDDSRRITVNIRTMLQQINHEQGYGPKPEVIDGETIDGD